MKTARTEKTNENRLAERDLVAEFHYFLCVVLVLVPDNILRKDSMTLKNLAKVTILRTNGSVEEHEVGRHILLPWIKRMIGAETTDSFRLKDGTDRVCILDDHGYETEGIESNGVLYLKPTKPLKPVNVAATELYHRICVPGTTHQIVGDVAIAHDEDFA